MAQGGDWLSRSGRGSPPPAPSPHPCALGGAPSREGGPPRPGRLGAERWREPPSRFRRGQRAGQCHREARSSLRPRAGGRPCRLRLFPRAHRGGARSLANRRERGGCSALRSEDGPRGRTARSASAGYVDDTRCSRAHSRLLSVVLRSQLGRGGCLKWVGACERPGVTVNCEAGGQSWRGGRRAVRSGLNFTLRDVGSPVPTPSCLPACHGAGLLRSRLSAGCLSATLWVALA